MFKQPAIVICMLFVALLSGGQSQGLRADDKPSYPLYPTVFLKPGDAQQLVLSAPDSKIGAGNRTGYYFTPVNETGDKTAAIKGVAVSADQMRMNELWDHYGTRFVALKLSATADAELGMFLIKVSAVPFGLPPDYETTVRLIVGK